MQEAGTGALQLLKFPWQLSPGRPSSPRPAAPPAQPAAQAPPQGWQGARRAWRHRPLTRHRSWGCWTAQAGATPGEDLARDRRVRGSGWPLPPGFGGGGSAVDLAAWVRRAQGSGWTLRSGFGERRGRGGPRRPVRRVRGFHRSARDSRAGTPASLCFRGAGGAQGGIGRCSWPWS